MMRIVQIGSFPESGNCIRGGVEASVFGLAKEQGKENEVHVFDVPRIGGGNGVEMIEGVTVHRFCNPGRKQFHAGRQVSSISKEIQALHPDICHIHGTNLFSWLMYRQLKKMKLPVIVTVHGLVLVEKRNALKKHFSVKRLVQYYYQGWVEKRFLSRLPIAIVDTDYVKDMVMNYPVHNKPTMHVIPQGIAETFFSVKCSEESNVVLSVGAIGERKGQLITLKAFERAEKEGVRAQLVMVGSVADQQYLKQLQDAIDRSDIRDKVLLCTDVSDKELMRFYEKAHLFALHSEEESQGIVFAEAMATGMPIIATRVGGIPYVVTHGECGLLSDYCNIDAFSENICRLMKDVELWHSMSDASRKAAEGYHWSSICHKIMHLYQVVKTPNLNS